MSCYFLNLTLHGKFEFPGKNLNKSEKRIYEEILENHSSSAVFLFLNCSRNRKLNIFPVTTVFFIYVQTLINLKREVYSIKVFTFKYIVKFNVAFSAE